ncbi:MAG TPA: CDP-alcohol phosphatidyltransferase family protein [Myxococcota bacterium]
MVKSMFGDRVDGWLHAWFPFLFHKRVSPNLLTVVGCGVSLLAAAAFAGGHFRSAGLLILAGGVFDLIDGVVARHHGITTRFGGFLDSTLDRLVDMALLVGIAVHFAASGDAGLVLLAGAALIASVLVSYAQARAELVVPDFRVGLFERAERVVVLALGALFGFLVPALWIVTLGSAVTVAQRFSKAYHEMEQIDASERAALRERG